MLRGGRLPLQQSPLSRWRTTTPAPRLRRAPAPTPFFSTTTIRRNDSVHVNQPTEESERAHGKATKGAPSRLRIHKIGVYGDDWAFFQARRSAEPATAHARLSLQGKSPLVDRSHEYQLHVAAMNARRQSRKASRERDGPPPEAQEAKDYYFRSVLPRPNDLKAVERRMAEMNPRQPRPDAPKAGHVTQVANKAEEYHFRSIWPRPNELKAVERHMAEMNARLLRHKAPKAGDGTQDANQAEDYYFHRLPPRDNKPTAAQPGTGIYLRRLWDREDARSEVAREHEHMPPRQVLQLQDKPQTARVDRDKLRDEQLSEGTPVPTGKRANIATDKLQVLMAPEPVRQASDGHRLGDQPQGAMAPGVGADSLAEMSPKVKNPITRQYKLVASERKPLFNPRPSGDQAKPFGAAQYSGDLSVAAADIGPAESFQRSFTEDPVLMKAKSLAASLPFSMQQPSWLDIHTGPRFRLVPFWKSAPGKILKSPQPSEDKPKSLESHISELQIKDETKLQPDEPQESPVKVSGSRSSKPEVTDLEESKVATDMKLKAAQHRPEVEMRDAPASEDDSSGAGDEGNGLVEPVQPPAPENRSIFEKLFAEQERTQGIDYGQLSSKFKTASSAAKRGEPGAVDRQNVPETAPRDGLNSSDGLSIFRQLFPEQAESATAHSEQGPPRATHELLDPPDGSVMISLRNEVRNWMSEEGQGEPSWPKPGEYGSHSTVVVISGTTPSLMDTDFYRIAPEGQHVEGWAGGLVKVIQAHDSISYEPLGQYYLLFYSRPSALAYLNEVWRLHELSRTLLHAPAASGRKVAKGPLDQAPVLPQPFLTDEERAAVRSFTLYPPHIRPVVSARMWNTELVNELAAKSNIADVLPTLRPEGSTPARVLLKLTSPDGQHGEGQGGLTADELWLTLRDDGRERSTPWMLANLTEGIMPVKPKFISEHYKITVKAEPVPVPLELDGDDDDGVDGLHDEQHGGRPAAGPPPPPDGKDGNGNAGGVDRNERFRRFVLTFTQPAIARRFVRCWHKRVVYDSVLERSVVIDAVAIM